MTSSSLECFLKTVEEQIAGIDVDLLSKVMKLSDEKNIYFHGVKNASNLLLIKEQGLRPLTPEGHGSYWAKGPRAFCHGTGNFALMDTPFFHYAIDSPNERFTLLTSTFNASSRLHIAKDIIPPELFYVHDFKLDLPNTYNQALTSVLQKILE